ncbi:MAG: hypothetical protein V7L21_19730 [Nostoc sp.]|uniref:hypothetical protein n=1 Tax=Nostoc sp. TaxID=1180 RepID=UPI002FF47AE7|nr:hypothetical protein [Nostoc sp. NMS9]
MREILKPKSEIQLSIGDLNFNFSEYLSDKFKAFFPTWHIIRWNHYRRGNLSKQRINCFPTHPKPGLNQASAVIFSPDPSDIQYLMLNRAGATG